MVAHRLADDGTLVETAAIAQSFRHKTTYSRTLAKTNTDGACVVFTGKKGGMSDGQPQAR